MYKFLKADEVTALLQSYVGKTIDELMGSRDNYIDEINDFELDISEDGYVAIENLLDNGSYKLSFQYATIVNLFAKTVKNREVIKGDNYRTFQKILTNCSITNTSDAEMISNVFDHTHEYDKMVAKMEEQIHVLDSAIAKKHKEEKTGLDHKPEDDKNVAEAEGAKTDVPERKEVKKGGKMKAVK